MQVFIKLQLAQYLCMHSQDPPAASSHHLAPNSSAQSPAEVIMNEIVYTGELSQF
jgi:hypothetical protein